VSFEVARGEVFCLLGPTVPARRRSSRSSRGTAPEKRDVRAKQLSGVQRRRLDLALALVGDPELTFLDEPTTGFDPAARRQAWSTIRSLYAVGKTIFLTTHFHGRGPEPRRSGGADECRSGPPDAITVLAGALDVSPRVIFESSNLRILGAAPDAPRAPADGS